MSGLMFIISGCESEDFADYPEADVQALMQYVTPNCKLHIVDQSGFDGSTGVFTSKNLMEHLGSKLTAKKFSLTDSPKDADLNIVIDVFTDEDPGSSDVYFCPQRHLVTKKFSGWKYADAYRLPKNEDAPKGYRTGELEFTAFECGIGEKPTLWYQTKKHQTPLKSKYNCNAELKIAKGDESPMEPTFIRPLKLHLGDILTTFPEHGPVDIFTGGLDENRRPTFGRFFIRQAEGPIESCTNQKMQESFYRQLDQYLTRFLPICEKQPN